MVKSKHNSKQKNLNGKSHFIEIEKEKEREVDFRPRMT